jgi:DNA helicase-2/ATP-dependent DNA helicase PcrA
MKTSSDLYKNVSCPNHAEVTEASLRMVRARAIRRVAIDSIMSHGNIDVRGELVSRFAAYGYKFESYDQMVENISRYESGINELTNKFERMRNDGYNIEKISRTEDTEVDYYGEPVKAVFDFIVTHPETGSVHAVKIKTGKYKARLDEASIPEAYCIAKYAQNIADTANNGASGYVDYAYIFNSSNQPRAEISETLYRNIVPKMDEIHARENPEQVLQRCSGEDCANCSMSLICNYEEPAMAEDVMRTVRSAGEITLSDEQQAVVSFNEGVARVNAGPGAGKTLVVAFRVLELLKSGVPENKIALLTFTRAGAEEMVARINQYCLEQEVLFVPADMTTGTFNSFCMNKIESYYEQLGFADAPQLLEDSKKYELCNRLLAEFPKITAWNYASYADVLKSMPFVKSQAVTELIKAFSLIKAGREPDNVPAGATNQVKAMFNKYQAELKRLCLIEYDDQIVLMEKLGEIVPDFYSTLGYEHIIVDEFQDTDLKQIQLLQKMIERNSHFKSFMAVGDDSQSIFGFRFTTPEYMINFGRYFGTGDGEEKEFTDLNLLTCRRCPQPIVSLANRINGLRTSRAAEAPLVTPKQSDLQPVIKGCYTQEQEVKFICDSIEADIAAGKDPSQIAILTRNKNDISPIAAELAKRQIPATICNPVPYIKDARVAAICEFWKSWQGNGDLGIAAYVNALGHGSLKDAPPLAIRDAIDHFEFPEDKGQSSFMSYARALDNIDQEGQFDACYRDFLSRLDKCRCYEELEDFFRTFDLYGHKDSFRREGKYEGVCITTVHSAKGLEWDTTYLTLTNFDSNDYHLHEDRYRNSGEMDENYRLWFVGATRAKTKLVMSGVFELPENKRTFGQAFRNQFVEMAYDLLGKPYDFSPRVANQLRVQAQLRERREREQRAAASVEQHRSRAGRAATRVEPVPAEGTMLQNDYGITTADGLVTEAELEAMNLTIDDFFGPSEPNPAPAINGGIAT